MQTPVGAEVELILCCARTRFDAVRAGRARELADRGLDWDLVHQVALRQKVLPLVCRRLAEIGTPPVPPEVLHRGREYASLTARYVLRLAHRLIELVALLEGHGLRPLPFKGPTLGQYAYGDLTVRPSMDLDILLDDADFLTARELLTAQGFRLGDFSSSWAAHLVKDDLSVDLHRRFASDRHPMPASFEAMWERRVAVPVLGARLTTLGAEDLLLALSIQLAKDRSRALQRLVHLCDMREIVERHPDLDWSRVAELASRAGARRTVHLALFLADELVGVSLPNEMRDAIGRDKAAREVGRRLAAPFLMGLQRVDPEALAHASWLQDLRFHLEMRERKREQLRFVWQFATDRLRLLVTPTQKDRDFLPLRPGHEWAYYFIRPLRVVGQVVGRRVAAAGGRRPQG